MKIKLSMEFQTIAAMIFKMEFKALKAQDMANNFMQFLYIG